MCLYSKETQAPALHVVCHNPLAYISFSHASFVPGTTIVSQREFSGCRSFPAASRERHVPPVARGRLAPPARRPSFADCSSLFVLTLLESSDAARGSVNACPSPVHGK